MEGYMKAFLRFSQNQTSCKAVYAVFFFFNNQIGAIVVEKVRYEGLRKPPGVSYLVSLVVRRGEI